jgi:IS5 family transposase
LETLAGLGPLPTQPTVHLDRGYDSGRTRIMLAGRGLDGHIAYKGTPAPTQASKRWPVERTHTWSNAFGKPCWCTEQRRRVVQFSLALAHAVIIVGRLVRRAWPCCRWQGRPGRRP